MPDPIAAEVKVRRGGNRRGARRAPAAGAGQGSEGIDMVKEIGADFGCVRSGDNRTVRAKLAGFGHAQQTVSNRPQLRLLGHC